MPSAGKSDRAHRATPSPTAPCFLTGPDLAYPYPLWVAVSHIENEVMRESDLALASYPLWLFLARGSGVGKPCDQTALGLTSSP
jgi:hypothetical protein